MKERIYMETKEGIVTKPPLICDNKVIYEINVDGGEFMVGSIGVQAVKDYLFVRKGQSIEIEGNITNSYIDVQKAKIDIAEIVNM